MAQLTLSISWDHLASSNTRNKRRGGRGHSWEYKASRQAIEMIGKAGVLASDRPVFAYDEPVAVTMEFHPPDRRRRDVLNLVKVLMDGLNGIVWHDDYQVERCVVERMDPDQSNPRVDIYAMSAS
jgi:Holliday junction resolvase RusA-like endonuclease